MKAIKKLGQNFLKDRFYLERIVESLSKMLEKNALAAERADGSVVSANAKRVELIEIGAGLGDLSAKLLSVYALSAFEIDARLCAFLRGALPRLRLQNADVLGLTFKRDGWLSSAPYVVVANLPYYAATKIIINLLKDTRCEAMIVMTQKEVAEKFCGTFGENGANLGEKFGESPESLRGGFGGGESFRSDFAPEFCALGVMTASVAKSIELVEIVPPEAFNPAPKVESAIFSIVKNAADWDDELEILLRASFTAPRKKLLKNLDSSGILRERFGDFCAANLLDSLGVSAEIRAHQLSSERYHQLLKKLKENKNARK